MCIVDIAGSVFEKIQVLTSPISCPFLSPSRCHVLIEKKNRDDLTVEVIFFGNGEKSGDVVVNKEASASASDVKPKL